MLFSQTFFYLLIGLGTALGLPALWLFVRAKWPALVERGKIVSGKRLISSFFIGLPVVAAVIIIAIRMSSSGIQQLQVTALLITSLMLVWSLAGIAGLATHVGEQLWPQAAGSATPWVTTWKGGLVVVGCLLLPFLGWFFLFLLLPVIGAGIQVRSWFARKSSAPVLEAPPLGASVPE